MAFLTKDIKKYLLECARVGSATEMHRLLQEYQEPSLAFDCWQAAVEAHNHLMGAYLFQHGLTNRCLMSGSKENILKVRSLLLAQKPSFNIQPWSVKAAHGQWSSEHNRPETDQETYTRFLLEMSSLSDDKHLFYISVLTQYGMQRLGEDGRLLQLIAYYKEPSKKQIKVAATSPRQPYFDSDRMEQYWPGITALVHTLDMLDLPDLTRKQQIHSFLNRLPVEVVQTPLPELDLS